MSKTPSARESNSAQPRPGLIWLAAAVAVGAVAGAWLWAKRAKESASDDVDLVLDLCDRAASRLEQSLSA